MITSFYLTIIVLVLVILFLIISKFIQRYLENEENRVSYNYSVKHPYTSIVLILFGFFFSEYFASFIPNQLSPLDPFFWRVPFINYLMEQLVGILYLGLLNLLFLIPIMTFIPKILGFKSWRNKNTAYFELIGLKNFKKVPKFLIISIMVLILLMILYSIYYTINPISHDYPIININAESYLIFRKISMIFWQQTYFYGITLTILLQISDKILMIFINSLILSIFYIFRLNIFGINVLIEYFSYNQIILFSILVLSSALISSILFYKTHNIISGLVFNSSIIITSYFLTSILFIV